MYLLLRSLTLCHYVVARNTTCVAHYNNDLHWLFMLTVGAEQLCASDVQAPRCNGLGLWKAPSNQILKSLQHPTEFKRFSTGARFIGGVSRCAAGVVHFEARTSTFWTSNAIWESSGLAPSLCPC
eukprot:1250329-Amphidinium_carterae.1